MALEEQKFEMAVDQPAELVWQVHFKNMQASLPDAVPGHFSRIEYLEGPPLAAGGVFKVCYDPQFGHYDSMKLKWEEMDHDKFTFKARLVEGGFLGKYFDELVYHYAILPGSDANSCVVSWKIVYKDRGNHDKHAVIMDELVKKSKNMIGHADSKNKSGQYLVPSKPAS